MFNRKSSDTGQESEADRLSLAVPMAPDKEVEESVVELNRRFIVRNLPPDDIAPLMFEQGLLTDMEHSRFRSLKDGARSDYDKSEHLISCLLKRGPGFLKTFCTILRSITPAKHITDKLELAYQTQTKIVFRRRGPRRSHSDRVPREYKMIRENEEQRCTRCSELQFQCEQLRKSHEELSTKDLQQLKEQVHYFIQEIRAKMRETNCKMNQLRQLFDSTKAQMLTIQNTMMEMERTMMQTSASSDMDLAIRWLEQILADRNLKDQVPPKFMSHAHKISDTGSEVECDSSTLAPEDSPQASVSDIKQRHSYRIRRWSFPPRIQMKGNYLTKQVEPKCQDTTAYLQYSASEQRRAQDYDADIQLQDQTVSYDIDEDDS